jgi:hypothetical protein
VSIPALVGAADERITLLFSGSACQHSYATLEQNLMRIPGVTRIDSHTVPNHILIDADSALVDPDSLVVRANNLLEAEPPCRITRMKSCISADLRTTIGQTPEETSSISQFGQ